MQNNELNELRGHFSLQVYERFKEEAYLIKGVYSTEQIDEMQLHIDLIQNNIDLDKDAYTNSKP